MSEHTKGKLICRGYSIYAEDWKTPVADTCLTASLPENDHANARRLVACWNAFDGLDTETVERMVNLPEFFKHTDPITQRDELLEALKLPGYSRPRIAKTTDGELEEALDAEDKEVRDQANAFLVVRAAIANSGGAMSTINDSGPAFPYTEANGCNDGGPGMSLRDYFAAKAMHSVWKDIPDNVNRTDALSYLGRLSYEMADAMLAARKEQQ